MNGNIRTALIYGSLREGRFCDTVGHWACSLISGMTEFDIDLIDPRQLSQNGLSIYLDPEALSAFQARIDAADAFIIVTPEYDHGSPAVLKQLIDSAYTEWNAKPVAFVSYGGVSGSIRAVEQLRQVFAELHAVSIKNNVSFPNAWSQFGAQGNLSNPERASKSMHSMLAQLRWWAHALRNARESVPYQEIVA